ncbi:hypothetical protein RUM43_009542 [Polyplax serrata]|uniref:Uncharacterized protein n=1 Tax=Polyplax serrata TaxID=468196 RepID=A0AAN8S4K9_POLSC
MENPVGGSRYQSPDGSSYIQTGAGQTKRYSDPLSTDLDNKDLFPVFLSSADEKPENKKMPTGCTQVGEDSGNSSDMSDSSSSG